VRRVVIPYYFNVTRQEKHFCTISVRREYEKVYGLYTLRVMSIPENDPLTKILFNNFWPIKCTDNKWLRKYD